MYIYYRVKDIVGNMVAYMPEYIYASLMIALACIAIEATAAWYRTVP